MNVAFGLMNLLGAFFIMALAVPMVTGRLPMNYWYGARFPGSFRSPEAWLAVNRYSGRIVILWMVPVALSGIIAFFVEFGEDSALVWAFTAPWLALFAALIQSWRYSQRF